MGISMELFPSLSDTDVSAPGSGGDAAMRVAVVVDKNAMRLAPTRSSHVCLA